MIASSNVSAMCRIAAALIWLTCPAMAGERVTNCKLTIICDAFGKSDALQKDWGFSALVECDGRRLLFDCGNDADKFAANFESL